MRRLFSSAIVHIGARGFVHIGARGFAASHGVQGASAAEKRIGLQDDRAHGRDFGENSLQFYSTRTT